MNLFCVLLSNFYLCLLLHLRGDEGHLNSKLLEWLTFRMGKLTNVQMYNGQTYKRY